MIKTRVQKVLKECLVEAFTKNAIITCDGLDNDEFIFVSGHKAYYEDKGCLGSFSETHGFLSAQHWARKYDWNVIGYLSKEEALTVEELIYSSIYGEEFKRELIKSLNLA